ncbi:YjzC family protein [Bacillus rubiinfantis]|uniref:YjzC family protein n=1 Tax=Bacillus rubiinfantis TaxID=1499680 RepID=UPI0005A7BB6A|nr:YjzC family protein [Bacillus rubiinfantis]
MAVILKPGEAAPLTGMYVEVGHGGGQIKRAQQIHVNQGEPLPMLNPYSLKIEHKGTIKERSRQHRWRLVKH